MFLILVDEPLFCSFLEYRSNGILYFCERFAECGDGSY